MRKDYFESTYSLRIRIVFIGVMLFLIGLFFSFPKIMESKIIIEEAEYTEILEVELVTQIQQQQQFKSARPAIPIEADEDSEIDTLDFMDTDIEGFDAFSIPTKQKDSKWTKKVDRKPQEKRKITPRYPEFCKSSGAQGEVKVEFYVDKSGNVDPKSISVIKSVPCLDEEVTKAIKKSKWRPARQGKQKTGLWVEKAFHFKLN